MTITASVYIATSLDGFIARPNDDIDWLTSPDMEIQGEDYGYQVFMDTVDVLVMGRNSFEKVLTFGAWPYSGKKVAVLSSRRVEIPQHLAETVFHLDLEPQGVIDYLERAGARHLYIDGGKTIQRFLNAGLIDELIITKIPILIGSGIALFGPLSRDIKLTHVETRQFANGFVQSRYRLPKQP